MINKKKSGGGQKIDAPRGSIFKMDPENISIVTDPNHYLYDPRSDAPVDEAMVLNVARYGVIEPVIVAVDGTDVLVVAGRRRVRAAREASRRLKAEGKSGVLVPVIHRTGDDQTLFGVMVSENEQRAPDAVIGKAQKAQRMIDLGASPAEVAVAFGVTSQTVRSWQALLTCDPKVRTAVARGDIAPSAAAQLAPLSRAEQQVKLAELVAAHPGKRVTVERARAAVRPAGVRPGKKAIRAVYAAALGRCNGSGPDTVAVVLGWVLGEYGRDKLMESAPWVDAKGE